MSASFDVVVVGAGVSGLTTAITLLEDGHRVRLVAADPPERTTSALAAAVWFPTHVGLSAQVSRWGAETFATLADQAAAGVPGVVMRETLALYPAAPEEQSWAAAVGGVRAADPGELPPGYQHGLRFTVPLAEMPRYLPWLHDRVRSLGGELTLRRLESLGELDGEADVVVNCTGLGARELVGDPTVSPVRGRIVRVVNPGLTMSVRDEHHPAGRAYVHPRSTDCILGGTIEDGEWDTTEDLAVSTSIIERCIDIVPALRGAEILEHVAGLRPGRPTVRLEEGDPLESGTRVVHDYGHGGSGITLSWGCAREVAALVGKTRG